MERGYFISFEGNDGAGKTTVCMEVKKRLEELGYSVIYTREPGGSKIAESIRDILLDVNNTKMDAKTEALLYAASRRQHLVEIVLPALEKGQIVLCDRFVDSSLAYQGHARGLGMDKVWDINAFGIHDHMPDLTLFLSVSLETGQKRMDVRGEKNRLDLEANDFHLKVREGYDLLIKKYPERIHVIDAEGNVDKVVDQAMKEIIGTIHG